MIFDTAEIILYKNRYSLLCSGTGRRSSAALTDNDSGKNKKKCKNSNRIMGRCVPLRNDGAMTIIMEVPELEGP